VRVHLAREHAAKLENLDFPGHTLDGIDDVLESAVVLFLGRQLAELAGLVERLLDAIQSGDDSLELGALAA
jgi:hypothetical protein